MAFNMSVFVDEDPAPTMPVLMRGGIRIEVDGVRLNRYQGEEEYDWLFDWHPEYVGEHIKMDLRALMECVLQFYQDEVVLYEPQKIDLMETADAFVVERLSVGELRIAFQKASGFGPESRLPPSEVAVGSVVTIEEFCSELLECAETVRSEAKRFGILDDPDFDRFEETLEELRAVE